MAAHPSYDSLPRYGMTEDNPDASLPRFAIEESARYLDFDDLDAMQTRVREASVDYSAAPPTKVHAKRALRAGTRPKPQARLDDVIEDLREAAGGPVARELSSRDIADATCELTADDLDEVVVLADGEAELIDAPPERPVWNVREASPLRLPPRPAIAAAPPSRAVTALAVGAGILLAVSAAAATLFFSGVTL